VGQGGFPPKNNPYSNTYNPGWRNHPNFSWSSNQNVQNPQGQQRNFQPSTSYQAPPHVVQPNPESKKNDLEGAILQFMTAQQQTKTQTSQANSKIRGTSGENGQGAEREEDGVNSHHKAYQTQEVMSSSRL
jgi:hypothetical protein